MILSESKKKIFLHIPKTAGSSLSNAIRAQISGKITGGKRTDWDYHTTIRSFEERLVSLDGYKIFTFVRNPWDRMYSWFCMLKTNVGGEIDDKTFKKWLMKGCHDMSSAFPDNGKKYCAQRTSQVEWMIDSNGNIRPDFIGRFENLEQDYKRLCKYLGIGAQKLGHQKKGNHKPYQDAYDEEMVEFVRQMHKVDIMEFGYEFK